MFSGLVDEMRELDDAALTARFRAAEAQARAREAEFAAMLGEVERRGLHRADGHSTVGAWPRVLARWSHRDAVARVRLAHLIVAVPAVGDALTGGTLGVAQAHEMARAAANPRCGHEIGDVVAILLDQATTLCFEDFTVVVRRWETLADTDGAHRHADAIHSARFARAGVHDGELHLTARGGALDGATITGILERFCQREFDADCAAARQAEADGTGRADDLPRTDAQRRFDAVTAIFLAAASTPPGSQPPEPVVNIVVDDVTFETHLCRRRLIALRPDLARARVDRQRCETTGGIALTPDDVLRAALAGHVRRVVFDSAGIVTNLGRRSRLFTGAAAEAVRLQSRRCAWPGCRTPAARSQLDHLIPWSDDGHSDADNGTCTCGRHNRLRNQGYRIERDDNGHLHTYRPGGTEIA